MNDYRENVEDITRSIISVFELRSPEEADDIADLLVHNRVVIVNYRKMSEADIHDIKTFLKGVLYAKGNIIEISNEVVIYSPDDKVVIEENKEKPLSFSAQMLLKSLKDY